MVAYIPDRDSINVHFLTDSSAQQGLLFIVSEEASMQGRPGFSETNYVAVRHGSTTVIEVIG